jgi:transposase
MIRRILEDGQPIREVARGFGISERTARKWLARFKAEGPRWLDNRSSCPENRCQPYG